MYFLKILEIDPTRWGQRSKFCVFWPNFTPKWSVFGITRIASVEFWHNLVQSSTLNLGTTSSHSFFKIRKFDLALRGQSSKFDLILPQNHVLACRSDPAGLMWTKIGTVKQLDPSDKPVMAFLQNFQIWPHTERSKFKIWPNFTPKSRFGLSFGSGKSDVDKNWHNQATWSYKQACKCVFEIFHKWTPTRRGQRLNLTRNLIQNSCFGF